METFAQAGPQVQMLLLICLTLLVVMIGSVDEAGERIISFVLQLKKVVYFNPAGILQSLIDLVGQLKTLLANKQDEEEEVEVEEDDKQQPPSK